MWRGGALAVTGGEGDSDGSSVVFWVASALIGALVIGMFVRTIAEAEKRSRVVLLAWLASGGAAFAAFAGGERQPALFAVAGTIIFTWGVAVVTNYRGVADAFPRRFGVGPFWQETSVGMLRFIFGFFALWGAGVIALGVSRLAG